MDKKIDNKKIYEKLSKKYKIPIKDIQRIIRLGIASMRRALATNKRIQFEFGHFVFFDHPKYSGFIKNGNKNEQNKLRNSKDSANTDNT